MTSCNVRMYTQQTLPDKSRRLIKTQLAHTCQGKVDSAWGKQQVDKVDRVIVATKIVDSTRSGAQRVTICGFCLATIKKRYMYVDLLCSAMRYGSICLKRAETEARKLRLSHIKLSALPQVISFYRRKGYAHVTDPCSEKPKKKKMGSKIFGYSMSKCLELKNNL